MTICKYFQQGRCVFGDKCKNEHIQENTSSKQATFGNQTWSSGASQNAPKPTAAISLFTAESITKDLTLGQEKPLWPLTSYSPAKYQPLLIVGLDESFEELRARAVTALKSGVINEYMKYEADRIAAADQIYTSAIANITQAYEQAHRQYLAPDAQAADTSVFGSSTKAPASAFGQPSAFGASSAFGGASGTTSAFGAPAPAPAFGKFGQPSFGQTAFSSTPATTSAFGQPTQPDSSIIKPASGAFGGGAFSAFAGTGASAFGSSTTPSSGGGGGGFSAFSGQPSAFGAGAAAAPSGGSVFGQPSAFGAAATSTPAASSGGSVFGQPSAFGAAGPAAPSGGSVFGQPSAFGSAVTSAFGAPAQGNTTSAFGAPAQGATSVFGQPSALGAQQPSTLSAFGGSSVFGTVPANTTTSSVFGPRGSASTSVFGQNNNNSSPFGASAPTGGGFGAQVSSPSAFGTTPTPSAFSSQPSLPPKPDFTSTNPKLSYKPELALDKYDALLPPNYLQLLPQAVKAAFESEAFEWGSVPEWVPPKELR